MIDASDTHAPGRTAVAATGALTKQIVAISAISALGGLLFGYDWVVIGGAKPFYEASFGMIQPAQKAWAVSCALIGCLAGAMLSGPLSDRHGRKPALLLAALLFVVTSIGTGLAQSVPAFIAWRICGGVAIGIASGISPLYIAEVAPASHRGQLVCLNQIAIVVGVLGAQVVNLLLAQPVPPEATMAQIAQSWNGTTGWRWMFMATAFPAAGFLIGCAFIPESPRWLARRGAIDRSRHVLERLNGAAYAEQSLEEYRSLSSEAGERSIGFVVRDPHFRKVLMIGMVIAALQQWCGINIIFNYAQEVFASAGYAVSDTLFNIVITGIVNMTFTLVALALVERAGRRRLLLLGSAGLAAIYLVLGACYMAGLQGWPLLLLVVTAIAVYAMTLAPVTWITLSEIFPSEARGASMAVATTTLWTASFLLVYTFPLLDSGLGTGATFWLYAVICASGFLFVKAFLPETRGRTLEDIERQWTE